MSDASVVRSRAGMRQRLVNPSQQTVLVARLDGSAESNDEYTRVNCGGFGRVRVFDKFTIHLQSRNASAPPRPHYRGLPAELPYRTQVFQLAGCNWACWYCFVDDELLDGVESRGRFLSASALVDLYLDQPNPPSVLDLSGGQPDLVPEWCLWILQEVDRRGLRGSVHVWIDDNLSGEFMRRYISPEDIAYMASFPGHSRVGCFKGYDPRSFEFNTGAASSLFTRQFSVMSSLIADGFDMYAYATFTAPPDPALADAMARFVDRLQAIDPMLPLRTIPLEVRPYSAAVKRVGSSRNSALDFQYEVAGAWESELARRFSPSELVSPYESVQLIARGTR